MLHHLKHALHKYWRPQRYALLDELLRNQHLSPAQMQAKQQADLSKTLAFAYQAVPYYRQTFPHEGARLSDLPILQKNEVITHRDALLADGLDVKTLKLGKTGGSTGQPVSFYYDAFKGELMRAGMTRSYMMSGWRPGQKILNFWGAKQDIKQSTSIYTTGKQAVKSWLAAEKTLPAYEITEAELWRWAQTVQAWRPALLQGYASILAELARFVIDQRLPMPDTLLGVYSTAEVLYDWQRALMEQAFGCKVFNQYGSREIPNMACECRHGNLHLFSDMVYMESVRIQDEDRLLVTSLTNKVMPLIRYEIGDAGRLKEGDCPCGSPFPLLEMDLCRSNDLIVTTDGKHIYPSYFIHLLDELTDIRQFQFIQSAPDQITLSLVSATPLNADEAIKLQARLHAEVDARLSLDIRQAQAIPRTTSGKHRFVINQLAQSGKRHA
jgi:phenylacetate-CoA ligase